MKFLIFILIPLSAYATGDDPRLAIDQVRECVEQAKLFMPSADYSGEKNEQALIGACRDVDPLCVTEVGESLHSSETLATGQFLTLVKACRGRGMGKCFRAMKDNTASFNRRELSQILALLKKCE